MSTKYFCDRCKLEIKIPDWFVEISQCSFDGEKKIICEDCKKSFEGWLEGTVVFGTEKKTITDEQIRKVLNLTSAPLPKRFNKGLVHREGHDTDLGPEADLIAEARRILEIRNEPIQTPQEELVDVPAVRTVRDEGEGSTVQGEENPS